MDWKKIAKKYWLLIASIIFVLVGIIMVNLALTQYMNSRQIYDDLNEYESSILLSTFLIFAGITSCIIFIVMKKREKEKKQAIEDELFAKSVMEQETELDTMTKKEIILNLKEFEVKVGEALDIKINENKLLGKTTADLFKEAQTILTNSRKVAKRRNMYDDGFISSIQQNVVDLEQYWRLSLKAEQMVATLTEDQKAEKARVIEHILRYRKHEEEDFHLKAELGAIKYEALVAKKLRIVRAELECTEYEALVARYEIFKKEEAERKEAHKEEEEKRLALQEQAKRDRAAELRAKGGRIGVKEKAELDMLREKGY